MKRVFFKIKKENLKKIREIKLICSLQSYLNPHPILL